MSKITITIGREGDQPFPITGGMVSRRHCQLEVEDNVWTLRDLNSSHGTFIRDKETGYFVPIEQKEIDPYTMICLGTDTNDGCTFYAYSVLHPDDYRPLFDYLRDLEDVFEDDRQKLEKKVHFQKMTIFALNVIVFLFSLPKSIDAEIRMWMLRIVQMASSGFAAFYDASSAKRKIEERRKRFHHCPNPACHEILTDKAIRKGECKCMKKNKKTSK